MWHVALLLLLLLLLLERTRENKRDHSGIGILGMCVSLW